MKIIGKNNQYDLIIKDIGYQIKQIGIDGYYSQTRQSYKMRIDIIDRVYLPGIAMTTYSFPVWSDGWTWKYVKESGLIYNSI